MSSLDKAVIVDNEKVLILPIIALPIFTSTLMLSSHMLKVGEKKNAKTLIVTNGNGFCQELWTILSDHELCEWAII